MDLGQRALQQQSSCLAKVPFKSQLRELDCQDFGGISLCAYIVQQFTSFVQVTFGLINPGLGHDGNRIAWHDVQPPVVELQRGRELSKESVSIGPNLQQVSVARVEDEGLFKIGNAFIPVSRPSENFAKSTRPFATVW